MIDDEETVTQISRGDWLYNFGEETRLDIGQSDEGFHYQLHVSTPSWENDPSWVGPFPTKDAAYNAGWKVKKERCDISGKREEAHEAAQEKHYAEVSAKLDAGLER